MSGRIAIILPGIGYTCDKPLLYYSAKLARSLGWDVTLVPYGGFQEKVRGDRDRLLKSAEIALSQTVDLLEKIDWTQYDDIIFISKSIGTAVATAYASKLSVPCRHILFTPLEETFDQPIRSAIAFHGTADPWANTDRIRELCGGAGIPLFITENANHSLETGNVLRDVHNLRSIMEHVESFLLAKEWPNEKPFP